MRVNYSSERREQIGYLNRGKKLPSATVELIRAAALARPPMSAETREKVSANSSVANLFEISRINNSPMSDGSHSIILRTIPKVAKFCNCSYKTVQQALQETGVVKKTRQVTAIDKAKNP